MAARAPEDQALPRGARGMTAIDEPVDAPTEPECEAEELALVRRAGSRGARRRDARWWAAAVAGSLAAVAALSVLFDAISTRFVPGNSDGATIALEGYAMNAGNLTLRGWAISLDSFWSLDAPFYAVAIRLDGLRPALLTLVPAVIYAAVVVAAVLIARSGQDGAGSAAAIAVVAALLALPSPDLAYFVLQGPWHVATTLCALLAFACLANGRFGRRWALGVAILAAGILGDAMVITFAVLPVVAAGIVAMARSRRLADGAALVAAGPAAGLLALIGRAAAQAAGTFTLVNRNIPIRWGQIAANVAHLGNRLPGLLGVGTIASTVPNGSPVFQVLRAAGVLAVLAAVLACAVQLVRGALHGYGATAFAGTAWRLDDLLVLATTADLVTFVWAAGSDNTDYAKYLTPSVVFAAVLAGRLAGRLTGRPGRPAGATRKRYRARAGRRGPLWLIGTGSALAIGLAGEVGVELSGPPATQPALALSSFLASHHLTRGLGDYWSSSIVTVESSGRVVVRPVTPAPNRTLRRYERQSAADWYAGTRFQFFVYDTAHPWRDVNALTAVKTWGEPSKVLSIGSYRILTWPHGLTVSTAVPNYGSPLQIFLSPGSPRSSTLPPSLRPGHSSSPG